MEIALYLLCLNFIYAIPTESNFVASIENDHHISPTTQKNGIFSRQFPPQIQNKEEEIKRTNPVRDTEKATLHREKVPNPIAEIGPHKFNNDLIDAEKANPNSATLQATNPLSPQNFNNDPINVKEANFFPKTHRAKVSNSPSESSILGSLEMENLFADIDKHQSSMGDKNHINLVSKAGEANLIQEKVPGSQLPGFVPQNSRKPSKWSESQKWGELIQDLEDAPKTESNIVSQIEKLRTPAAKKRRNQKAIASRKSLIEDKKRTKLVSKAGEANLIQEKEKIPGSQHSGAVPQNSDNPLKRTWSKEWSEFVQVLENDRETESKLVSSDSLQVDGPQPFIRPAIKKQRNQKVGDLGKFMSADDQVMKNVLENHQEWDKPNPAGVAPVNLKKTHRRTTSKDWDHFLQFLEAKHVAENYPVVPPNMQRVLKGETLVRPVPNFRIIEKPAGIFKMML